MKRVAIIPARGGSKRLPRKNIRPFFGKPMLHYPIAAAKACRLFDAVIVSSEDEEIGAIAREGGAFWFRRPPELASDHATTIDVLAHVVRQLIADGAHEIEEVCCIYPCTPLLEPGDLITGFERLTAWPAAYAFAVRLYDAPPQRMLKQAPLGGMLTAVWPQFENTRNQDLEPRWYDAGQFYWGVAHAWLEGIPIYGGRSVGVEIPRHRAIDIDTFEDWQMAEAVYAAYKLGGGLK